MNAVEPDLIAPEVSYQFLESTDVPLEQPNVFSPLVSFQYLEWPGDTTLTFHSSPEVSYFLKNGALEILNQPESQIATLDSTFALSVTAVGEQPLRYQWLFNRVPIQQETSSTLTRIHASANDAGFYSVSITDVSGTVRSQSARVSVYNSPLGPFLQDLVLSDPRKPLSIPQQLVTTVVPGNLQKKYFDKDQARYQKTIVLTHGWNSDPSAWANHMADQLHDLHPNINIVAWDWSTNADRALPFGSYVYCGPEGVALGKALMESLGDGYENDIHFIGHSLGTLVNAAAANYIHGDFRPPDALHVPYSSYLSSHTYITLLDEASDVASFELDNGGWHFLISSKDKQVLNKLTDQSGTLIRDVIPNHYARVDNYISWVGNIHSKAMNTLLWREFNPLPTAKHSYSYRWYDLSVCPPPRSLLGYSYAPEATPFLQPPSEEGYFRQSIDFTDDALVLVPINKDEVWSSAPFPLLGFPFEKDNYVGSPVENYTTDISNLIAPLPLERLGEFTSIPVERLWLPPTSLGTLVGEMKADRALAAKEATTKLEQATWSLSFSVSPPAEATAQPIFVRIPVQIPLEATGVRFEYKLEKAQRGEVLMFGFGDEKNFEAPVDYTVQGEWYKSPFVPVGDFHGTDTSVIFAMTGRTPSTAGSFSIRNIEFLVPPRPQLQISQTDTAITLSWPFSALDWTLEMTSNLEDHASWSPVQAVVEVVGMSRTATVVKDAERKYFRLRK